jgi:hypothetical protein
MTGTPAHQCDRLTRPITKVRQTGDEHAGFTPSVQIRQYITWLIRNKPSLRLVAQRLRLYRSAIKCTTLMMTVYDGRWRIGFMVPPTHHNSATGIAMVAAQLSS